MASKPPKKDDKPNVPEEPELTDDEITALGQLHSLFSSYVEELEKQDTSDKFIDKQANRYNTAIKVLKTGLINSKKE